jgi:hypothetical protein
VDGRVAGRVNVEVIQAVIAGAIGPKNRSAFGPVNPEALPRVNHGVDRGAIAGADPRVKGSVVAGVNQGADRDVDRSVNPDANTDADAGADPEANQSITATPRCLRIDFYSTSWDRLLLTDD